VRTGENGPEESGWESGIQVEAGDGARGNAFEGRGWRRQEKAGEGAVVSGREALSQGEVFLLESFKACRNIPTGRGASSRP
jgi:hypothetical protein